MTADECGSLPVGQKVDSRAVHPTSGLEIRMNMELRFGPAPAKIKLSRKAIKATLAAHPLGRRGRYWFEDQSGLYLSVSKGGCASYCLRYQKLSGQGGDFTIGRADILTPQEAKDKARDSLAALALHRRDPLDARREARKEAQMAPTRAFRALAQEFLHAAEIRALAPRTLDGWRLLLDRHVLPKLGELDAGAITRREGEGLPSGCPRWDSQEGRTRGGPEGRKPNGQRHPCRHTQSLQLGH